ANRLGEVGRRAEGLAAAEEAVDLYRELVTLNRDAHLPDLAMSVNNLAVALGEAGRRAECMAAAEEAVNLYRELAANEPSLYAEHLARVQQIKSAVEDLLPTQSSPHGQA
ncbi:tetratricopeptide repeat protein, partial [Rhizocola hellebori]|uniref:tetratricopeptide repeat protein n=1 Tax=Rhizocola hellebori TaxID=1392758 RepID=UPI0019419ADF